MSAVRVAWETGRMGGRKEPAVKTEHVDAIHDLVAHAAAVDYSRLPRPAIERARFAVLDTLGVALAGASNPATRAIQAVVRSAGGLPQATAIGWDLRLPAGDAGLVNTATARALDYDDIHYSIGHHPSVSNVPAALAAAELVGAGGRQVLTAIALGQDFGLRLRRACPLRLGGHTWVAQTYAALESSLTAAKVLGLDYSRLRDAVGIGFLFFGGTPLSQHDGATAHLVHHGSGTRAGIMAALFAAEGITGPRNVLESPLGLYHAYHKGQFSRELLLDRLGEHFLGTDAGFKAYPTCSMFHAGIDAALALHAELRPTASDLSEVRVLVNRSAYVSSARQPWSPPATIIDSQFSIPYAVGLALIQGRVSLQDFTPEAIRRPAVLEAASRVLPIHDIELDKIPTQAAPITVAVKTRDGRTASRRVAAAKGEAENSLNPEELRAKFRDCAAFAPHPLPQERVERAIALVERLEELPNLSELMAAVG